MLVAAECIGRPKQESINRFCKVLHCNGNSVGFLVLRSFVLVLKSLSIYMGKILELLVKIKLNFVVTSEVADLNGILCIIEPSDAIDEILFSGACQRL